MVRLGDDMWEASQAQAPARSTSLHDDRIPGPAPEKALTYIKGFDGLRAIAVLTVIASHAIPRVVPEGGLGVDLFFVLSGFLITRILISEQISTGSIDFVRFYARRFLRLAPALWLLLLVYVSVRMVKSNPNRAEILLSALSSGLYFMNWTRAFNIGPTGALGHTWSLAVEEQFYLLWPLILLVLLVELERPNVWKAVLALIIASTAWNIYLAHTGASIARLYNGFDTHAETLLFGCILVLMPAARWTSIASSLWYVPVALLAIRAFGFWPPMPYWIILSLDGALCAWVVISVLGSQEDLRLHILNSAPLVYIGRISYGIYLWHFPIIGFFSGYLESYQLFLLATALSIIIASASFHIIELRALRMKRLFSADARGSTTMRG